MGQIKGLLSRNIYSKRESWTTALRLTERGGCKNRQSMQHSRLVIRPTRRTATFHILQTNSQYTILYNIIFGTGDDDEQPGLIPGDTVRDGVHYEPTLSWLWPVLRFKKGNVLENYSPKDID